MTYQNPKPLLYDEIPEASIDQTRNEPSTSYAPCCDMYFSFIDVLGFKQTFDENRERTDDEFAKKYKDTFEYFNQLMNSVPFDRSDYQWNSGQTSDSLYFYTKRSDYLALFIRLYLHFSYYAMSKDVFFRGGVAKGRLFLDKPHQFYGDCVIKAYLLEDTIAKSPRVVLDQATYQDLKKYESISDYIYGVDAPNRCYVKPFAEVSINELHNLTGIPLPSFREISDSTITSIRNNIERNMTRFEFDDGVYQKYAFLQSEFNKVYELETKK